MISINIITVLILPSDNPNPHSDPSTAVGKDQQAFYLFLHDWRGLQAATDNGQHTAQQRQHRGQDKKTTLENEGQTGNNYACIHRESMNMMMVRYLDPIMCSPLHKQLYTVSTGIDTRDTDLCGFDKRP